MGSNKHKHKSKKRKHNRSSESSEREYEKERRHHKKHSKDKKEKRSKPILVDEYDSSNSDDVIIVTPPPPPKISRPVSPSPPPKKIAKLSHVSPPPPPVIRRRKSPTPPPVIRRRKSPTPPPVTRRRKSPTPPPVTRRRKSPTPPPVIRRRKSPTPPPAPSVSRENKATTNSSSDASLSIEETNKLRLKLGLKPLDVNSAKPKENDKEKKETFGGIDMGDFVHKPPENISTKTYNEKLKEKLTLKREKRLLEEKLANVKKLAEGSDSDDDVSKWVEKNRKVINEKEQAEKRAKELDALDEVFGIGELIEEDMKSRKKYAYTAKDLKGLKVEHSSDKFVEGREIVLTLKDKGVLEEEDDTLVNVNILDEERYKKNIDRRKQKPGYNAYDDSADLEEEIFDKKVLSKYDEEIEGEKKSSFTLGVSSKTVEEARREAIRQKLQQQHVGKRLETLAMALTPASEYFTEQEIETKFKKIKKKVRKIRKRKVLKADDLLRDDYATKDEPIEDPALRGIGKRRNNSSRVKVKEEVKEEPMDEDLDVDDLPPPLPIDTSNIKVEVDDEDDKDLQLALHRSRKLQQIETLQSNNSTDINDVSMEDASGNAAGGSIVLNATAEFCRTLGDIPTYGQAGNREEEAQELLDFEKELKEEKMRKEEIDSLTTGWNEVATADVPPVDIVTPTEVPILDAEPDISTGVAGALKMAICKGYVQNETEKRPSASRFAHLQAQNYSIEDKAYTMEDDKHARRERYNGPTSDFKEKEGYKPNVKLEYIDDDGHILSAKEAFRYLSHKFHGKGPGKNKIEKRMKKTEQEALMKQMSSTDTPLGTLNMLQQKQKETQSPFVVLSGSKHGHSTAIAKLKM